MSVYVIYIEVSGLTFVALEIDEHYYICKQGRY